MADTRLEVLMNRVKQLEDILLCRHCHGSGEKDHRMLGVVRCSICDGTGNRLDALERRDD